MSWKLRRSWPRSISIHAGRGGRSVGLNCGDSSAMSLGGNSRLCSVDGPISSSVTVLIQLRFRSGQNSAASFLARRPKALAYVRAVITAEAANLSDIGIRFLPRRCKRGAESDHIRDAVARRQELAVAVPRDFVPPHIAVVAVERRGDLHRQWRALDLHVGI